MNIAIITAGGSGKRMNTNDIPKQFLRVCNKPIIVYTMEHFENCPEIDAIIVSCIADWIPHMRKIVDDFGMKKVKAIVRGGESGQESIYNGLISARKLSRDTNNIVLVHDGVRPLIDEELIKENIHCVKENGSCITTASVNETVTVFSNTKIEKVLDRNTLLHARAPQSFWLEDLLICHNKAITEKKMDFIDSCHLMNYYGYKLNVLEGPASNIKITTKQDYYIMRTIIQTYEDEQFQ